MSALSNRVASLLFMALCYSVEFSVQVNNWLFNQCCKYIQLSAKSHADLALLIKLSRIGVSIFVFNLLVKKLVGFINFKL